MHIKGSVNFIFSKINYCKFIFEIRVNFILLIHMYGCYPPIKLKILVCKYWKFLSVKVQIQ